MRLNKNGHKNDKRSEHPDPHLLTPPSQKHPDGG